MTTYSLNYNKKIVKLIQQYIINYDEIQVLKNRSVY